MSGQVLSSSKFYSVGNEEKGPSSYSLWANIFSNYKHLEKETDI